MEQAKSYCQAIRGGELSGVHREYHDRVYGFPAGNDHDLFGRMLLEINQAGLSWGLILNKRENFVKAYANFDIDAVSNFDADDIQRLLGDAGIVRNKLKVNAAIYNARVIRGLQSEYGSFKRWLDGHHPLTRGEWTKLFKKTFKFTGGEITNAFLMGTGCLPGAHDTGCPILTDIKKTKPRWMEG